MSNGMRALERRHDAFFPREKIKCRQRLFIGCRRVGGPPDLAEIAVFGTDGGLVQTGGYRVRQVDLAVLVLQQIRHGPLQYARRPA